MVYAGQVGFKNVQRYMDVAVPGQIEGMGQP
jgi:hypothetical protein